MQSVLTHDTWDQIVAACTHQIPWWAGGVTVRCSLPEPESVGLPYHQEALCVFRACDDQPVAVALLSSASAWQVARSDGWHGRAWASGPVQSTWDDLWAKLSQSPQKAVEGRYLQPIDPLLVCSELQRRTRPGMTVQILGAPRLPNPLAPAGWPTCYHHAQKSGNVLRLVGPDGRERDPARADPEEEGWLSAAEQAPYFEGAGILPGCLRAYLAGMPSGWSVVQS